MKSNKTELRPTSERNTNKLNANSKLKVPEVFSPCSSHSVSGNIKINTAIKYGYSTPVKSPGKSSDLRNSPGVKALVSCSSKKGKLLRDLESDSGNESELLAPKTTGKVVRGKKQALSTIRTAKSRGKGDSSKGKETAVTNKEEGSSFNSRLSKHILHEVQNSPLLTTPISTNKSSKVTNSRLTKSAAPSMLLKPKATGKQKSPVDSLFKKTLTKTLALEVEQHNESIYDFVASSPEEAMQSKGRRRKPVAATTNPKVIAARSKLSLKSRRTRVQAEDKGEDIENVRRHTDEQGKNDIYDFDECADYDTVKDEKLKPASQTKANNSKMGNQKQNQTKPK